MKSYIIETSKELGATIKIVWLENAVDKLGNTVEYRCYEEPLNLDEIKRRADDLKRRIAELEEEMAVWETIIAQAPKQDGTVMQ